MARSRPFCREAEPLFDLHTVIFPEGSLILTGGRLAAVETFSIKITLYTVSGYFYHYYCFYDVLT